MRWNDDCTMTTTGHSTTTPMRAIAGPSHSSGESLRRAGIEFILMWFRVMRGARGTGPHAESLGVASSTARRGGLLQLRKHRRRVAGDRGADRLLDLGLHVRPRGVA